MRAWLTIASLFVFGGCMPSGDYTTIVDDDRYDLLRFNMPDLLRDDAERCAKIIRFASGADLGGDQFSEEMLERVVNFWQVVDQRILSDQTIGDVLPSGGDADETASILPEGVKIPTAVARACGEYSGQVSVKTGFISLDDTIEIALNSDPMVFEKMGVSAEEVKAGLSVISEQAKMLEGISVEDRVHCVAIFQAAKMANPSVEAYSNVWIAALIGMIEDGELDPTSIRERSSFWQTLNQKGFDAVISMEAFSEQASLCDGWINDAVSEQAAE